MATPVTFPLTPAAENPAQHVDDLFEQAAEDAFSTLATTEEYSPVDGDPVDVQVIWERGTSLTVPGREARIPDRRHRAHLLVSEVGRPARGSTLTDGEALRTIDEIESDDGIVVVVVVK